MTTEQLNQLYLVRQSCRSFSDRPVAKESVEKICALAGTAPSACNLQPWRVYAVTGEKLPVAKALLKARGKAPFVDDAPVLLVIAEDTRASRESNPALSYFAPYDVGEFTAYLVLAAKAEGLDSCTLGWHDAPELKEKLGIPADLSVPYVIAIGYASGGYETRAKIRKPQEEILSFLD